MTDIEDVYEGENVIVWKDEEFTHLSILNVAISFPNETWNEIRNELRKL